MLLLLTACAHVPGYGGGCAHGCCHTPHPRDLDISQATYLRGSGGVEVDVADLAHRIEADKPIEFSVVFKREYDLSTYELYVGCGGCASDRSKGEGDGWDIPNASNLLNTSDHYQPGVLEPFTQHPYFPLLPPGDARMYNVSQLKTCTTHWSVRLLTHANASEGMAWSVALGCEDGLECEQFTLWERFLFPLYQIRNHGSAWNDLGFTLPVVAAAVLVFVTFLRDAFGGWYALYVPVPTANFVFSSPRVCVAWEWSLRCTLYFLIVCALLVDVLESGVHVVISLLVLRDAEAPYDGKGLGTFFWLVLGIFKLAPLACVLFSWFHARTTPRVGWRTAPFRCAERHSPFWAHGAWSLAEIFLGCVSLLFLGAAGYWVLGFGLVLEGFLRLYQWLATPKRAAVPGNASPITEAEWNSQHLNFPSERPGALLQLLALSLRNLHSKNEVEPLLNTPKPPTPEPPTPGSPTPKASTSSPPKYNVVCKEEKCWKV